MKLEKQLSGPLFFEKNRVFRVYTGGALFADFFGDDSSDGFFPEEWVASSVKAVNKISRGEKEGVSLVEGTDIYFDDLLKEYTHDLLGDRTEFGVLTKVLDSAVRLPIQAHPDKAFSRKFFDSDYGKAESWIVLATRPGAKLYFGFKDAISKEDFTDAVNKSKTDKQVMVPLLNEVPVKPGDVFFVPARMVHAIGEGCLILEVQEPSDFTIQPEHWCEDYELNDQEMYIGLTQNIALDVFDYSVYGEEAISRGRMIPKIVEKTDSICYEKLITYDDTPCFAVERYTLKNSEYKLWQAPAIYIITDGDGELIWQNHTRTVKKGDYFFLPYCVKDNVKIQTSGNLQYVVCLPPKNGK